MTALTICIVLSAILLFCCSQSSVSCFRPIRVFISSDQQDLLTRVKHQYSLQPHRSLPNGFSVELNDEKILDSLKSIEGITVEEVQQLAIRGWFEPVPFDEIARETSHLQMTRSVTQDRPARRYVPSSQVDWGKQSIYRYDGLAAVNTTHGEGIRVAVIDTGLREHPDIKSPIVCRDYTGSDVVDGSCEDIDGHGTFTAGIIAADGGTDGRGVFGVAPGVQLLIFRVIGENGTGNSDDVALAVQDAADRGANIINLSLGSNAISVHLQSAVQYATNKGALVIAAAGNDGPTAGSIDYPAAYAQVVAVAATQLIDPKGSPSNASNLAIAEYSSRGVAGSKGSDGIQFAEIEIAAPGSSIVSTYLGTKYAKGSGTSAAAPHASGVAALLWQQMLRQQQQHNGNANGTATKVRSKLRKQVIDITKSMGGGAAKGYDIASGFGQPFFDLTAQEEHAQP